MRVNGGRDPGHDEGGGLILGQVGPSQVERDVPEGSFAGKYRHSAFLESVGDMVKVLELQMTELLMLRNMMELHRDVQNVMVDGDLPVDKVIPGSGDGAK